MQAGRTLFKVHKSILASNSGLFATMFSLPQGPESSDGTDDHPLVVHEVPENVLENLLRVLYPKWGMEPNFSQDDLTALLNAAHRLQCDSIRQRAIGLLKQMVQSPVERIELARAYAIDGWVWPAFRKLAESMIELSPGDCERVGPVLAQKLLRAKLHLAHTRSMRFACALAERPAEALPCAHVVAFAQAALTGPVKDFNSTIVPAFNERRPLRPGSGGQEKCCSLQVLEQMQWGRIIGWEADEASIRRIYDS
ncbi:hypothetical protein AURDEDRAFT_69895 [Auricularia subglabra TFB-10046 SS5]|nr:hypothetical protein AURDEDRAFT_69895 [Auricularia subglabra TFB-10046 SS5]